MKSRTKVISFTMLLFFLSHQAYALRCGSKVVEINDRKHTVLHKCGEPDYADSYEQILPGFPYHTRQVEVWTYNFGSNKFMQELIFRNGRLYRINDLGYGY